MLKLGNIDIGGVFLGGTGVAEAYLGNQLVYSSGYNINISGDTRIAYVIYNGTNMTAPFKIKRGESITFRTVASLASFRRFAYIYLNGTDVGVDASNPIGKSYTFAPSSNLSVACESGTSGNAGIITATTA